MNTYERLQGETDDELIVRVCKDKEIIGNWTQVGNILNSLLNRCCDESTYRKRYRLLTGTHDRIKVKKQICDTDDDSINELDLKRIELEKERKKLQTTKVEYNKMLRLESRFELLYEIVADNIKTLPLPEFKPFEVEDNEKAYVMTLSDIHMGAKFQSRNNEYSIDVAKDRFEYLLSQMIKFVKDHHLDEIKILCLGDCVQGLLRLSDISINEVSVVQSIVEVSNCIAAFINELSAYCKVDYYHTPTSNHTQTRPLGTSRNEIPSEDVEYIIGHYIKDMLLNNSRVNVNLNCGYDYIEFNIFDYNIIALHGHTIKNINTSLRDLCSFHKKFYDIVFLGHFHAGMEITGGEDICSDTEILVAPSFIGSDPYSDSLMKGSKASVKIFGFNDIGCHTETYKIVLN